MLQFPRNRVYCPWPSPERATLLHGDRRNHLCLPSMTSSSTSMSSGEGHNTVTSTDFENPFLSSITIAATADELRQARPAPLLPAPAINEPRHLQQRDPRQAPLTENLLSLPYPPKCPAMALRSKGTVFLGYQSEIRNPRTPSIIDEPLR